MNPLHGTPIDAITQLCEAVLSQKENNSLGLVLTEFKVLEINLEDIPILDLAIGSYPQLGRLPNLSQVLLQKKKSHNEGRIAKYGKDGKPIDVEKAKAEALKKQEATKLRIIRYLFRQGATLISTESFIPYFWPRLRLFYVHFNSINVDIPTHITHVLYNAMRVYIIGDKSIELVRNSFFGAYSGKQSNTRTPKMGD
jgi:hypothetical protein